MSAPAAADPAAAPPAGSPPPPAVRALVWLLAAAAAGTVVAEVLNWAYAPEGGFALTVRTSWALLRSVGFLALIWHVRRGRAGARPFGLILAVTTVFALGRLVVPRSGEPAAPGLVGFVVVLALCAAVVALLYRSAAVAEFLRRPQRRLLLRRTGLVREEVRPRRPPVPAALLTARVAALTYGPLMLVPSVVAAGTLLDGRLLALPVVVGWFVAGLAASYAVLLLSLFLLRGHRWARAALAVLTGLVLLVDLPLCWWLLGLDGLLRDGAPLAVAAGLTWYALWRAGRAAPAATTRAG